MISDIIINTFYFFANFIVQLLKNTFGTVQFDGSISDGILTMAGYYSAVDNILPVATILAIIAIELTIEIAYFSYKLIKWGYQKIPTIS
jgi:ABC-type uncharacterized transport system permease subunit